MNDIYLIRHTTPAVAKGICYGQTDLDTTETFAAEAEVIRGVLPEAGFFGSIYTSPLQRCSRLARYLFPAHDLSLQPSLMELHCGQWEMRHWDDLPKEEIDPWMADFVNIRVPGGESYIDLHDRVTRCWAEVVESAAVQPAAVVAHGGVIRSILAGLTNTPLINSFKAFSLHYGCVIRVSHREGFWEYETLSNVAPLEKEQHKPKSFYEPRT
ncbi:MAG: alpha-ribazole phosphatase [Bacteroidetes bacterium]|nr:alpha-ribazole phosphatase [Bacteroidota bacterium]